jgi:mono/diheme cytochrome c family protein
VKIQRFNAAAVVVCVLAFTVTSSTRYASAASFAAAARVIDSRCLSCHDSDTREAGIDLTPLLRKENSSYGEYTRLWIKVEKMVASGEMPPTDERALEVPEREAIKQWFRESFVSRKGKPHIGPTPLRRLTRYELESTLEDVLSIKLKTPYRDTITGRIEKSTITSLVPSDIPGESGFDNDAHRMESLKPPLKEISEAVHYALGVFSNDPAARQAVLGQAELSKNATKGEVTQFISAFLLRACRCDRRRVQELADAYYGLYQKHMRVSQDSRNSLLHVFEMILVSPEFLYRLEKSRNQDTPYPVTGVELATRLSYFLWSTAPDDELMQLGQNGSLLNDDVLKSQVARMLNSPKRLSLSENFAGQWLGFDDLLSNREYFKDERWNREAYDEVLFFFDELIKSDRSILEMVQSVWIYRRASALKDRRHGYVRIESESFKNEYADVLSERQSKSDNKRLRYDPPVLVKAKDDREGGIITSAAIMRLTASKSRTSPIRRGVWILNTVIGKTLEPPPNVPSLEEAREALNLKENPSVSEVIKQHVSRSECVSCHKEIDPLGLGLENFAPTGVWRTHYPDKAPIVSAGIMPNGKSFNTPQEMKFLLLETYKDDIATSFVKQMLAYALGRKIEPFDRVSVDSIVRKVKEDGYKLNTAIEQIVLSQQFRFRQDH